MYPTKRNMIANPLGISEEVIELAKSTPIFERRVRVYAYPEDDIAIGPIGINDSLGAILKNRSAEIYQWLFTPACNLVYKIVENNLLYYPVALTGVMDFDILVEDNWGMDMEDMKRKLCQMPQIAYCGRNYYGSGLMCLVPIMALRRYADHARALRKAFERSGVKVRVNYSELHVRFVSYDANAYFNEEAVEFKILDYP